MKRSFISVLLAVALPLMSCAHQSKGNVSQTAKTNFDGLPNKDENLVWRCPAVSYERVNSDGTIDRWSSCIVEVGDIEVYQIRGAIIPLGKLAFSKDIAPMTFDSYSLGETYQSGSIKLVNYVALHDASKVQVGYEVLFPECSVDDFTLYIDNQDEDGAAEALEHVLNNMEIASYCDLN